MAERDVLIDTQAGQCWGRGGGWRINTLGWNAVGGTELEGGLAQTFEGVEAKGLGVLVG